MNKWIAYHWKQTLITLLTLYGVVEITRWVLEAVAYVKSNGYTEALFGYLVHWYIAEIAIVWTFYILAMLLVWKYN